MARAGAFRERVTFQRMASTTDDFGNVTAASWSNLATRNAEFTERTGFQDDQQGALQDVAIARMKVRSDTTMKTITVADMSAGEPSVGSPQINQEHALTGAGFVTGSLSLASPEIDQEHALTAIAIATGAPSVASVAMSEDGNLYG